MNELEFEISFANDVDKKILPDVIQYLKRSRALINVEEERFTMKESGVRDFLDFCSDHIDSKKIQFRIEDTDWRSISEARDILDMQWVDELILSKSVESYFQPIVDRNEEIYAYESLARFKREDGSLVYPSEVFSAAKNRGRLYALDRLCRMTAVKYAAPFKNKAKVFINFIPTSIYSPEFCLRSTVELTDSLGIDSSQLVFEVVETEHVEDLSHLKRILAYYKEKGFAYALDDVGEGYSTTEMLSELKPHYMKLDMSYAQGVSTDAEKQVIAGALLEKALDIGAVPLAEGVEYRADYEWLKQRGYQLFQGYLFGKPTPVHLLH